MAVRDCADGASSVANENYGQLSRILLGNRSRAAGYGIAAAVLSPANSGAIQVCSCSPFTRLVLVQLIFLVTDR